MEPETISRLFEALALGNDERITHEEWRKGYGRWLESERQFDEPGPTRLSTSLDPTEPLAAPHFRHGRRIAALVLPATAEPTTASADIRLLSARKLIAYIDGGGRMAIRQSLEDGWHRRLLRRCDGAGTTSRARDEGRQKRRCTCWGVVALSYAWVTPADPDPERAQLLGLRPVLLWWMCERARRKLGGYRGLCRRPDATIQTPDFGIFIDFMSMFQPVRTAAQQASFDRALRNIGLLYGHKGTVVFKLTDTPLPAGGDPDRVYSKRGWTHLERRLGDLEAPASNSLDVANWPLAAFERAERKRGPLQLRESEEELAAQGDHSEVLRPGTLGALVRDTGAPVSPKHFEEELKKKVFSYDSDRAVCAGLYRGVAEPLLAGVERLMFDGPPWTSDDWRHLGGVLACCTKLRC